MVGEGKHQQGLQQPRLRCPRCHSMETKFCYFNNYNYSQPRYICKTCKRYWTHGGRLSSIPFRGGCVKKGRHSRAQSLFTSSGGGNDFFRVFISSSPTPPLTTIGSGTGVPNLHFTGSGFMFAAQNLSYPQPLGNNSMQLSFSRSNIMSPLMGYDGSLNQFIGNLVNQHQSQSQSHHVHQLCQVPITPNGSAGIWAPSFISTAPTSVTTSSNYPALTPNAAIDRDNIVTTVSHSGGSSSVDWLGQFSSYVPLP